METSPDNFTSFLPYTFLAVIPAIALVFLLRRHRQNTSKNRSCPHCYAAVESNEIECNNCHRKIVFA